MFPSSLDKWQMLALSHWLFSLFLAEKVQLRWLFKTFVWGGIFQGDESDSFCSPVAALQLWCFCSPSNTCLQCYTIPDRLMEGKVHNMTATKLCYSDSSDICVCHSISNKEEMMSHHFYAGPECGLKNRVLNLRVALNVMELHHYLSFIWFILW